MEWARTLLIGCCIIILSISISDAASKIVDVLKLHVWHVVHNNCTKDKI